MPTQLLPWKGQPCIATSVLQPAACLQQACVQQCACKLAVFVTSTMHKRPKPCTAAFQCAEEASALVRLLLLRATCCAIRAERAASSDLLGGSPTLSNSQLWHGSSEGMLRRWLAAAALLLASSARAERTEVGPGVCHPDCSKYG